MNDEQTSIPIQEVDLRLQAFHLSDSRKGNTVSRQREVFDHE